MIIRGLILVAAQLLAAQALAQTNGRPPIDLSLPIDCKIGETCFIADYVDVEPNRRFRDYTCRGLSSDGRLGMVFRLPDERAMKDGVEVTAAADGEVKGFRGRLEDGDPLGEGCGNSVLIDHGNGWETQYCHLRQNSISVYRRKKIKAGEALGLAGQSGDAAFPQVEFILRYNGSAVDPMTGAKAMEGCGAELNGLWSPQALVSLRYLATAVLNEGFSAEEPTAERVARGELQSPALSPGLPRLYYYVRLFGMRNGDTEELTIRAADGTVLKQVQSVYDLGSRTEYLNTIAAERPENGWPAGPYEAEYQLIRTGRTLIQRTIGLESEAPG